MNLYVQSVIGQIRDRRLSQALDAELSDHIEEKTALYMERGFDEGDAREKANADMGEDAETVAAQLSGIHRSGKVGDVLLSLLCILIFFASLFFVSLFLFLEKNSVDYNTQLRKAGECLQAFTFPFSILWIAKKRKLVFPMLLCAVQFVLLFPFFLSQTTFLFYAVSGRPLQYLQMHEIWSLHVQHPVLLILNGCVTGIYVALSLCFAFFLFCKKARRTSKAQLIWSRRCNRCFGIVTVLFICAALSQFVLNEALKAEIIPAPAAEESAQTYPEGYGWIVIASDEPITVEGIDTPLQNVRLLERQFMQKGVTQDFRENELEGLSPEEREEFSRMLGYDSYAELMENLDFLEQRAQLLEYSDVYLQLELDPDWDKYYLLDYGADVYAAQPDPVFEVQAVAADRYLTHELYGNSFQLDAHRYYRVITYDETYDEENLKVYTIAAQQDYAPAKGETIALQMCYSGDDFEILLKNGE